MPALRQPQPPAAQVQIPGRVVRAAQHQLEPLLGQPPGLLCAHAPGDVAAGAAVAAEHAVVIENRHAAKRDPARAALCGSARCTTKSRNGRRASSVARCLFQSAALRLGAGCSQRVLPSISAKGTPGKPQTELMSGAWNSTNRSSASCSQYQSDKTPVRLRNRASLAASAAVWAAAARRPARRHRCRPARPSPVVAANSAYSPP